VPAHLRARGPVGRRISVAPRSAVELFDDFQGDPPGADVQAALATLACVGCGCSENVPCEDGCFWVRYDPPTCSRCATGL
jgi:hypothetical protein